MGRNRGRRSGAQTGAAGKSLIERFIGASQLSLWSAQTAGQAGPNRITQCVFSTFACLDFTGHVSSAFSLLSRAWILRVMSINPELYS
jgi:hypothetical protein